MKKLLLALAVVLIFAIVVSDSGAIVICKGWGGALKLRDGSCGYGETDVTNLFQGTAAGLNTYVQFNDGGTFGGNIGFTYDKTNRSVFIGNTASATSGSLVQSGSNISDMLPRTTVTTLNVSRQSPDTTDGVLSTGLEVIAKSPVGSKQYVTGLSTGLFNYGNTGDVYGSGFGVGLWNHAEAHGTGSTWSIATEVLDSVGNANIIGYEVLLSRAAPSSKTSVAIDIVASGNQPLTYGIRLGQNEGTTATWGKGIYAEQYAIGSGANDSFIELKDYFRVKRDGTIVVSSIIEYDSNVYTAYDKVNNCFLFVIGGNTIGYINATGFHNGSP
jgi:hypothetical protein